jgi:phenylacetate-coenzyme A ligase PaaK-like adenylate-forming protein
MRWMFTTFEERRRLEALSAAELQAHQLSRLNALLRQILPQNAFYAEKLGTSRQLESLAELEQVPFTFKQELLSPREDELALNLTWPAER